MLSTSEAFLLAPTRPSTPIWSWLGFLAAAIGAVGLIGLFATYAAPLPLQRALAREAALDAALAASRGPDPAAALEALRPRLDDSAAALLPYSADEPARIARERPLMRARLETEAAIVAVRLRWLIGLVTLMAIVFAAAVLRGLTRSL
jgi:hypothetical protein